MRPGLIDIVPLVRLPRDVRQRYTYKTQSALQLFSIVRIRFRKQLVWGVVMGSATDKTVVKRILSVESISPYGALTKTQRVLFQSLCDDYAASESIALLTLLPQLAVRLSSQANVESETKLPAAKKLDRSLRQVVSRRGRRATISTTLLQPGTEQWRSLIIHLAGTDGQVVCLFPDRYSMEYAATLDSALSPLLIDSTLTSTQAAAAYDLVSSGTRRVIYGTRSALFAPFQKLTATVVWNAHDENFRSWDQQPHYDARVLADTLRRLKMTLVMVAPLPPLLWQEPSSFLQFHKKASSLKKVILHNAPEQGTKHSPISSAAIDIIKSVKGRSLFYCSRRGFGYLWCQSCQTVVVCAYCQAPMLITSAEKATTWPCPSCRHLVAIPAQCSTCSSPVLNLRGLGAANVSAWCKKEFPGRTIITLERNEIKNPAQLNSTLQQIRRDKNCIVVATSFIFPYLWSLPQPTLTIVVRPEHMLSIPSWAANENAVNRLVLLRDNTQEVFLLDSATPENKIFTRLARGEELQLLRDEFAERSLRKFPPSIRLVSIQLPIPDIKTYDKCIETINQMPRLSGAVLSQGTPGRGPLVLRVPLEFDIKKLWMIFPGEWKVDINPASWHTAPQPYIDGT